jgi:hypothetical protein
VYILVTGNTGIFCLPEDQSGMTFPAIRFTMTTGEREIGSLFMRKSFFNKSDFHPCCPGNFRHLLFFVKIPFSLWYSPSIRSMAGGTIHFQAIAMGRLGKDNRRHTQARQLYKQSENVSHLYRHSGSIKRTEGFCPEC